MLIAGLMFLVAQAVTPQAPTPALLTDARRAFNESLFDYPSARFRDVRGNQAVLCGNVNAKNQLGGYVGWRPFAFVRFDEQPGTLYVGDDVMVDTFCADVARFVAGDYADRLTPRA